MEMRRKKKMAIKRLRRYRADWLPFIYNTPVPWENLFVSFLLSHLDRRSRPLYAGLPAADNS